MSETIKNPIREEVFKNRHSSRRPEIHLTYPWPGTLDPATESYVLTFSPSKRKPGSISSKGRWNANTILYRGRWRGRRKPWRLREGSAIS